MEKKKLIVNCAKCDMRNIKKELLDSYESMVINAAVIITNPQTELLMAPYEVKMDCANIISIEEDVEMITQNGLYYIKKGDKIPEKKFYLMINGKLLIEGGTEEILKQCAGATINGKVVCPNSILSALPSMVVNGKTESYPDGAVLVGSVFCPDKVFALRAKKQSYYASSKVVLADENLDVQTMAEKGVQFITPKALVKESLLEQAILLFDETTKIDVLPQEMNYVAADIPLDMNTIRKYGKRLYMDDDVRIEDEKVLQEIEKLYVNGELKIKEELEKTVLEKTAFMEYEKLVVERGTWITDKISVQVDKKLFEQCTGEIHIKDVAKVKIHPKVSADMILERLKLVDCAMVTCTEEQHSAVDLVSTDVAQISSSEEDGDMGILDMLKGLKDTKVINASSYTF